MTAMKKTTFTFFMIGLTMVLQSCQTNKTLKKYCCSELNVFNCNKGILNKIYSARHRQLFSIRVYTVMSPNAHGNYFLLTYGRKKLLIKEHADSATSITKFNEFTKDIPFNDSIRNLLKEKILYEAQSSFHRGL